MVVRRMRGALKSLFRRMLETGQHFGINVLPVHFYSEIPDLRDLRRSDHWMKPRSMMGVHGIEIEEQFAFLEACCPEELVRRLGEGDVYDACRNENGEAGFGPVEADFLYCFIHTKRPQRIIQVGAGLSTAVMLLAAGESGYNVEITCIDPYPNGFIRRSCRSGKVRLIPKKVELVDLETLTDLGDEGLLFIDSTHAVKPGSDVNYLVLEVLPRLKCGTWVHFHDIYFPYDYSRDILNDSLFFPNESAFLHSFLIHNERYTLRASLGMLHYEDPSRLQRFLPSYTPSENRYGLKISDGPFPSSAYLQTIK